MSEVFQKYDKPLIQLRVSAAGAPAVWTSAFVPMLLLSLP